jgi:hypothetical protein
MQKSLLAAAFAAALMGFGAAAQAQSVAVVTVAPPPPRHEVVPGPRAGWIWAPGHYEYRGNEYAWVTGHWMRERVGYEYREPRWVQRADGSWIFVGNNWERRMERLHARGRDFDGDGVPDRRDRFPRNPNRS